MWAKAFWPGLNLGLDYAEYIPRQPRQFRGEVPWGPPEQAAETPRIGHSDPPSDYCYRQTRVGEQAAGFGQAALDNPLLPGFGKGPGVKPSSRATSRSDSASLWRSDLGWFLDALGFTTLTADPWVTHPVGP
jgi:hypothetical protein